LTERQYWIAFNRVAGVGPVRLRLLLECFGTLSEAWKADQAALASAGLDQRTLDNMIETRRTLDPAAELARVDKLGIAVLTWEDDLYPPLLAELRKIDQAPPLLYMRGTVSEADIWALTIVGTRSISAYGRQVTHQLAADLAANGLTVVSGLARGVDAEAHTAAMDAGGRTIAVMGCGLDTIYPPEHRQLAARIVQHGALLSPFPLQTAPEAKNFAPRSKVLSGLARGVLVTEASDKSGAMLTAGAALEHGREVFAVPGNITAHGSNGTNRLIQEGAHPVLAAEDVLGVLNLERVTQYVEAQTSLPDVSDSERVVLQHLTRDPLHIDELTRACGMAVAQVSSSLTMLELKGMVRQVGTMTYVRT
jgi:DNA processing protein